MIADYPERQGNCMYCGQYDRLPEKDECYRCWKKEQNLKETFAASWFTGMVKKSIKEEYNKRMAARRRRASVEMGAYER